MTSAIHNRQAGLGKEIKLIIQDVLVNTAGTTSIDTKANISIHIGLLIMLQVLLGGWGSVLDLADGLHLYSTSLTGESLSERM